MTNNIKLSERNAENLRQRTEAEGISPEFIAEQAILSFSQLNKDQREELAWLAIGILIRCAKEERDLKLSSPR